MHLLNRSVGAFLAVWLVSTASWTTCAAANANDWQKLEDAGTDAFRKRDFEQAEKNLLAAVKEADGTNDKQLGVSLSDLGLVYDAEKKYDQAESCYLISISVKEKTPADIASLISTLNNLAILYRSEKKLPAAQSIYERSLQLSDQHYGPEHPSVALALNNLAGVLMQESRSADAEPLLKRALPIWEK